MPDPEGFRELDIPPYLDSADHDFIKKFYNPLLSRSVEYKRGVGFFTSNWVKSAARGIVELAKNGGSTKWLVSPILEKDDWEAIKRGEMAKRNEVIQNSLEAVIDDLENALQKNIHNAIAWMVYDGLLEIQLAVPEQNLSGDFHDKFGIFKDAQGNRVAFHGSQNDSETALENYESYDVFCSWQSEIDADRVDWHDRRFDRLWNDELADVGVYDIPKSVLNDIARTRDSEDRPYPKPVMTESDKTDITLREYQEEAVQAWFENSNRGIFEMATGTGKTYTAIGGLKQLLETEDSPLAVVIAVPVTHLAEQWRQSLSEWDFASVDMVYGSANSEWRSSLSDGLSDLNIGVADYKIFLTTHQTLSTDFFREAIRDAGCKKLLIADEVHGVGSSHQRKGLEEAYEYRLGLSATPERYYDEEGTNALQEFFEGVVFSYTLEDAIPEYLVEYEYYPQIVELTEEELENYRGLSKRLATEVSKEDPDQDLIERLAIKRSRILKSAERKYEALGDLITKLGEPEHLLVYTDPQQIDTAQEILNQNGIIQHKFTFREDDEEREQLLRSFASGDYDALVAMRCLDEGVNVPNTRQAILMASSNNPKQFIQRRGRVLRKAEGKNRAEIYDMIVVPSLNPTRDMITAEQGILESELKRFDEFAQTAINETEARLAIQRIKTIYELDTDEETSTAEES